MDKTMNLVDLVSKYRQQYYPSGSLDWLQWIQDYQERLNTQKPTLEHKLLSGVELQEVLNGLKEPSYQEAATTAFISDYLLSFGFTLKSRETDIKANETELVFTAQNSDPKIYCRVDLDAVSIGDGKYQHACGHSTNMASVLTTATRIKKNHLNVGIVFQPAEEGPGNKIDGYVQPEGLGGGQYLRKKGVYEKIPALISCHIDTSLKDNEARISSGIGTAAAYRFTYRAIGKPAHAALPWQGENPVEKISQFLVDLKNVFNGLPKDEYGLVTPSKVNTAECELNSLSPWAEVRGISRNSGLTSLKLFEDFMQKWGADIELEAPPIINDSQLANTATDVAKEQGFNVIIEPARFRDETAWAGPLTKPWVKNPESFRQGCPRILHFFTAAYNSETGGLHSMNFVPDFQRAIESQVVMIYGIVAKLN